jgi:hypothetical protein
LHPRYGRGLPVGDFGARPPGPGDVTRVTQFDERMIPAEVTGCLRVYGGADGTVKVSGSGERAHAELSGPDSVLA